MNKKSILILAIFAFSITIQTNESKVDWKHKVGLLTLTAAGIVSMKHFKNKISKLEADIADKYIFEANFKTKLGHDLDLISSDTGKYTKLLNKERAKARSFPYSGFFSSFALTSLAFVNLLKN